MKSPTIILIFLFFPCLLFLSSLRETYSIEGLAGSGDKLEIELDIKTEKDLLLLNELGLDCSGLGVCTCLVDTLQLLRLKKVNYPFRPPGRSNSTNQSQGIKQSRVFQLKLEIKNELELNLIKNLGLNCAKIGECTTEVDIEQVKQLKQNRINFSGIREGIRVEGISSPEGIHSETFKPAGSIYGENDSAYLVPWQSWTCSPITINNASYDATVEELELYYSVYDFDGEIYNLCVELSNENVTKELSLWYYQGVGYQISETERDTTVFVGENVNQTWKLWVWDFSYPDRSVILPWHITIWFSGPPVSRANSYDYYIPDIWDSVCSPITINTAPSIARVTSLDLHYDIIHPYIGDLLVWATDADNSSRYVLCCSGGSSDVHETFTGITDFNGELVNQTWKLCANDWVEGDYGYIDFWSITLWYQDLPDLVIKSMTPSNTNPMKDSIISVDMVIKNQGSREASSFYVGLYYNLSYPPDIYTWEDKEEYISSLASDSSKIVTFTGVTSSDTATWNMYGLVDCYGYREESNEDNNYIGPKTVKWRDLNSLPDLVIEEAWVSNDCNPTLDESVYVDVVIENIGGSNAYHNFGFYTDIFYNQTSPPIPPATGDAYHLTTGEFQPGEIDTFSFVLPNPSWAETWIMWLLVDSDPLRIVEGNENNNVFGPIYVYWEAPVFKSVTITRAQIIENAMKFVNVVWTCPTINRTPPKKCKTWDSDYTVGVQYQGEPYEWGGWDIPGDPTNTQCFLFYITEDDTGSKRAGSHKSNDCIPYNSSCECEPGDPSWATGVDCSGLVSRAWDIFWVNSSGKKFKPGNPTLIDSFTIELSDYYSLRRGDALISTKKGHTFLFEEWVSDTLMQVIEARDFGVGDDRSRVDKHPWTKRTLERDEYKPYKYKDVIEEWLVIPGDANNDGKVSVSDVVYLIIYLFKGGVEPFPPCKADVNDDSKVSVSDVVYLINYLFKGGPPLNNGCS
jgi:subtilisin-like proprotein convertase family protein